MASNLVYSVTVFILLAVAVRCEVFTALATLTAALHHEEDLANGLRQYVELEKARLQRVLE